MFKHLTMEEREVISQMHFAGQSQAAIARSLGRDGSTIGRELKRNGQADGSYSACGAQQQAMARRRNRPRQPKIDDPETNTYIRMWLTQRWSPDQIAGRLKQEFPDEPRRQVSHQTIYDWIKQDDDRDLWQQYLRRGPNFRESRPRSFERFDCGTTRVTRLPKALLSIRPILKQIAGKLDGWSSQHDRNNPGLTADEQSLV